MFPPPKELLDYYSSSKPLICELELCPYMCEFWPESELAKYNQEYQVTIYAQGYFGFATNGGGEMYAISPTNEIVYLPYIRYGSKSRRQTCLDMERV